MGFKKPQISKWLVVTLLLSGTLYASDVRELSWDDLLPEAEVLVPLPQSTETIDGNWDHSSFDDPFMSPAYPTGVVEELDGVQARIPGFVVPLEYADNGEVSEFMLVPYFGACIHYPPPPPNQLVYVVLEAPVEIEDPWEPVWATGELKTEARGTDIGSAGYTMNAELIEPYEY